MELFLDLDSIETGEHWPDRLRDALRTSRRMVCVWSPSYFQSAWCVSEWKSFLERERRLKMRPHGLIAPLKFHDGEQFPPEAKAVQWEDVSAYTATAPAFWTSSRAMELEDRLKTEASAASLPPLLLQLLPGGANQFPGGILPPLRTSAFSRRT
ncbi:MAG: toll/interleukin-1 receptor domain-containing protein [Bryobacteraceae bacterium]|nr:toll/interleukin-1 receptor domain-containing protein [Bryobacteraceae bacterium]